MKKKRKYWYDITIEECVLCGHCRQYRVRKHGRKPTANKRIHYTQFACDQHFM